MRQRHSSLHVGALAQMQRIAKATSLHAAARVRCRRARKSFISCRRHVHALSFFCRRVITVLSPRCRSVALLLLLYRARMETAKTQENDMAAGLARAPAARAANTSPRRIPDVARPARRAHRRNPERGAAMELRRPDAPSRIGQAAVSVGSEGRSCVRIPVPSRDRAAATTKKICPATQSSNRETLVLPRSSFSAIPSAVAPFNVRGSRMLVCQHARVIGIFDQTR
jgi:hypothetical protein